MEMLKIIIADNDPKFKKELAVFINNLGDNYTLCGSFSSGAALLNAIEEKVPDIVITNSRLNVISGLEVIRECNTKWPHIKFIIMSEMPNFELYRSILHLKVTDIIQKPVIEDSFNDSLHYVTDIITKEKIQATLSNVNNERRNRLLFDAVRKETPSTHPSLDRINRKYDCCLKDGEFRAVIVKFDYKDSYRQEIRDSHMAYLDNAICDTFVPVCHDVLLVNKRTSAMFVLNYGTSLSVKIRDMLDELFSSTRDYVSNDATDCTLCISDAFNDFINIKDATTQCHYHNWLRIFTGTNTIITSDDAIVPTANVREKANQYKENICIHVDNANIEAFNETIKAFFDEPVSFLKTDAAADTLCNVRGYILNRYSDIIDANMDIEVAKTRFNSSMYNSTTITQLKDAFIRISNEYLNLAKESRSSFNEHILRQTYAYIQRHYAEKISLERIAAAVSLSPGYFSNYFKKATGANFSDYLCEVRVKVAKDLLRNTNKSIGEIACESGFNDSRYFSKVFHKATNMTPSKYRNLKE